MSSGNSENKNKRPKIAVWGATGVGKTTYLAGAMLAVNTFCSPTWKMQAGGEKEERNKTFDFITFEMDRLAGGKPPQATPPGEPSEYVFQFIQEGNLMGTRGRFHEVGLVDTAGGNIEASIDDDKPGYGYFEMLCQSQGILMLIDPELKDENGVPMPQKSSTENISYYVLINLLIQHLQDTKRNSLTLDIPLAICLTKIDKADHWPYRERPAEYTEEILGRAAFQQIVTSFNPRKINYFAVSVAGLYQNPRNGEYVPNIDEHGEKLHNFRQWRPYQILDPLFWLLDQIEAQRNSRLSWWRRALRNKLREANYRSCQI